MDQVKVVLILHGYDAINRNVLFKLNKGAQGSIS